MFPAGNNTRIFPNKTRHFRDPPSNFTEANTHPAPFPSSSSPTHAVFFRADIIVWRGLALTYHVPYYGIFGDWGYYKHKSCLSLA